MAPLPKAIRRAAKAFRLGASAAMGLVALMHGSNLAAAEFQIGVYGGWNGSFDSDIHLVQPGNTNMTLKDVPWDGDSFGDPPYWGLRGIYWLDAHPNWGLMVDYNHAKVIADQGAVVSVSGTRDDTQVGPKEPVGTTFSTMEFTDGLNEIYGGAMYRWPFERWTPYVGLGVGASFPHVEIRRTGAPIRTFEYQLTGVAVEGLVGVEYHITPRLSAFGDYKLSFSSNDADVNGGGTLETDIWTNHVIFGLSYRFGGTPAPAYETADYPK
jgi:lipid A oxidase